MDVLSTDSLPRFTDADLLDRLLTLPPEARDALDFGVIGFDRSTHVVQYNAYESRAARLDPTRVLGQHVFIEVAPCMNNYLVAQRFETAGLDALCVHAAHAAHAGAAAPAGRPGLPAAIRAGAAHVLSTLPRR